MSGLLPENLIIPNFLVYKKKEFFENKKKILNKINVNFKKSFILRS